jgi:hypothetical protein
MSMDPHKWITYDKLTALARQRIETVYPYLKLENCVFQEKTSGVFFKQANSVKIEKLLDPQRTPAPPAPPKAAAPARASKR